MEKAIRTFKDTHDRASQTARSAVQARTVSAEALKRPSLFSHSWH